MYKVKLIEKILVTQYTLYKTKFLCKTEAVGSRVLQLYGLLATIHPVFFYWPAVLYKQMQSKICILN